MKHNEDGHILRGYLAFKHAPFLSWESLIHFWVHLRRAQYRKEDDVNLMLLPRMDKLDADLNMGRAHALVQSLGRGGREGVGWTRIECISHTGCVPFYRNLRRRHVQHCHRNISDYTITPDVIICSGQ
jgi:hypothetical protein